jgi:hypothetical protein
MATGEHIASRLLGLILRRSIIPCARKDCLAIRRLEDVDQSVLAAPFKEAAADLPDAAG